MSLYIYCELFVVYTLWTLYCTANCLYYHLRGLYWRYNGIHETIVQNRKPENYRKCAQVLKRVFGHRLDEFIEARESDFVLVHERFEDPEYVLRDDVTLYTITETEAIFVKQVANWKKALYHYDFFILGQFGSCEYVIKMPLNQFTTLAENLPKSDSKIIFLQNQARCGGTLLTNIFKATDRCITFNEPHCFNAICKHLFTDNIWHGDVARRNFRNVVRLLCKPYKGLGEQPMAFVIKPTVTSIISIEIIPEALPDALQFFLYRDPAAVSTSIRRIGQVLYTLKLTMYLPNIPKAIAPLLRLIGYVDVDFRGFTPTGSAELEFGHRLACLSMYRTMQALRHGVKVTLIRYRDLVDYREKIIKQFFTICGIPDDLVQKGSSALDRDSQLESPISREILNKVMPVPPKITPEFLDIARAMSKEFGVPNVDDFKDPTFRLEQSLTP